jgi:dUTP pyrophosphatase
MLQVMNKSGIATKKQLVVGACVVDSGYSGEVFVNLHNIGNKEVYIHPGQKIAQAVLLPVLTPAIEEVPTDQVYDDETTRGDGGFGSTGDF